MCKSRIGCILLAVFVICVLAESGSANALLQNNIKGQVLDKKNNSLAGVLIRLYRGAKPLPNSVRTDKDGNYSISFDAGDPISLVRYDLTNWYPSRVENISGVRDHRINKVLLESGSALSGQELQEVSATLTTLRTVDLENGMTHENFNSQYAGVLTTLPKPSPIMFLNEQEQAYFRPTEKLYYWGDSYYKRPTSGLRKSLVEITKSLGERVGSDSIRVSVEATTASSGWKVSTFQYVVNNTLHVHVLGEPPSNILSEAPANYVISETYDNLSSVTQLVFHGSKGDVTVELPKRQ